MPKATSGGESNAWEPQAEVQAEAEVQAPPPASAPKPEHVEYAVGVLGVPEEEAEAMKKADLVELNRSGQPQGM